MKFEVVGEASMERALRKIARQVPKDAQSALHIEAELIRTDSMRRTPVEFGTLRGSTVVRSDGALGESMTVAEEGDFSPAELPPSKATKDSPEAVVGVGGGASEYAVYVHENLQAHHETGEAKFLENAYNAAIPGMSRRIGQRLGAALRRAT